MAKNEPTPNSVMEELLEELVDAQDRTTSGIRSIALFLFITTGTALVGALVYVAGISTLDSQLESIGGLIAICGAIVALAVGVIELLSTRKNKI
jgi:hypothetical protein